MLPPSSVVMPVRGYSDRVNHALAFAAKHGDREVSRGTRLPYGTQAPNVAVILTKYDRDEDTVVAGILYDVVEDYLRDHYTPEMLSQRVADKFGQHALEIALGVAIRLADDDGVDLTPDERREDQLARISNVSDEARWVCAANAVHTGGTLLADLGRTIDPNAIWGRFQAGKSGTVRWYRRLYERLADSGFVAPIMRELQEVVESLERHELSGALPEGPRSRREPPLSS